MHGCCDLALPKITTTYYVLCRLLISWDVSFNPGPTSHTVKDCRVLCANIRGLHGNLPGLVGAANDCDVLFLSETMVSTRRHGCELLVPGFGKPHLKNRDCGILGAIGMAAYVRSGYRATRVKQYECSCHEMLVIRVSGRLTNYYIFGLYRSPNADDSIYDCLLTNIGVVQRKDRNACFIFAGDLNAHHLCWGSDRTTPNGVAARDFGSASGCAQLVYEPTRVAGDGKSVLDLVFTDVPDTVQVRVCAPIGNSDHATLKIGIQVTQPIQPVVSEGVVFLKNRVDWSLVRQDVMGMQWRAIYGAVCPVTALNTSLNAIIERRVPTRNIKFRSQSKPWFNDECQRAKRAKDVAYRKWTRDRTRSNFESYTSQRQLTERIYSRAQALSHERTRDALGQSVRPRMWWSKLKSAVFGSDSGSPPIIDEGGSLVCDPKAKACALSRFFDGKQCRDDITIPLSCHPEPKLNSFAFRSKDVLKILSELDEHGGTDPIGIFPKFFKEARNELAPKLAIVFRLLVKRGSFPVCWRTADVVPVPKEPSSAMVSNNRPISITPILSKVFEKLTARPLIRFFENEGFLPKCQFAYRKGLGTCDALLTIMHELQLALDKGYEARLVQLDFSAAFDRVSHDGLLYKLRDRGVGGNVISIIEQFLMNRRQRVKVDGSFSEFVEVVSGVPQGSVLGPLLFVIYTADLFDVVENRLVNYADDSTLFSICKRPADRSAVALSLNRDLNRISEWCDRWMMKLNPLKTKTLIVSRSRTVLPVHGSLFLNGLVLPVSETLVILGVNLDSKLTLEHHVRSVVSSAARSMGIVRRASKIFGTTNVLTTCFRSYVLSRLEYCAPSWCSSAESHLGLLDRVVSRAQGLCGVVLCDLKHRRKVSCLCMLYKIYNNPDHALRDYLVPMRRTRVTRAASSAHEHQLDPSRCKTEQFKRCFIPSSVQAWNCLPREVFDRTNLQQFKRRVNRQVGVLR